MLRFALIFVALPAMADEPIVEHVQINGSRVNVTLSHPDTGWDHYADGWRDETPDGQVIGTRVLHHPHVHEQPFTRSLTLDNPPPAGAVIRARDSLDGWGQTIYPISDY